MERDQWLLRGITRDRLTLSLLLLLLLTDLTFVIDILRGHTAVRLLPHALIGLGIFSVLLVAYGLSRAAWVRNVLVVAVTVLTVTAMPTPVLREIMSYHILLPAICALLLTTLPMVVGVGVGTYLLILWQAGFVGVYADGGNAAFYGLLISVLVMSRLLLEQSNVQLAHANADLESRVAAHTADLRAALDQVQALMQARSATVLDVAHDLCNYTQNLRAHATFLEWSYADMQAGVALAPGEDLPALLSTLHGAIDRVISFANGLQDAALLEQHQLPLHLAPYPLTDTLTLIIAPLAAVFAHQQIALVRVPPAQEVMVVTDPIYLRRVIENMLGNALKFTAQQQADGRHTIGQVVVAWGVPEGSTQAQITITDTGIGIAPDDLARLGERFTRVHQRPIAGSGVGLHFAMRVIAAMGGQLQIASAGLGCGTTVRLLLLLVEPTSAPAAPTLPPIAPLDRDHNRQRSTQNSLPAPTL